MIVDWAELSSAELGTNLAQTTLVIPIGATEQHGPNLPVGVDAMVAEHVARRAAEQVTDRRVLVAPVLAYGSSHHHLPRAGTLSLSSTTMLAVLRDLLDSAAVTGVQRVLILNGHGGNEDLARQAARDSTLTHPLVAAAVGYWSLAWDEVVDTARGYGISPVPGHAGSFETSLLLAMHPELVTTTEVPPGVSATRAASRTHPLAGVVIERHGWIDVIGGYSDDPSPASAEAGRAILDKVVAKCAAFLTDFASDIEPGTR
jgi:creatinine amidohydrolase